MANTFTSVMGKILAQGLLALREQAAIVRLINTDWSNEVAQKGDTINVPIPSAIAVQNVSPGNTPPSTADISPTTVPIVLDKWKEAPFYLTDKELGEIATNVGVRNMQVSEAVKALANQVASDLYAEYKGIYGFEGTAGTTPFAADTTAATAMRKRLNNQLAPMDTRRAILDPDAEANALNLRAFQDTSWRGNGEGIVEGQIGRKFGFDWYMDQLVPTHTKGAAGTPLVDQADVAIGDTQVHFDGFTTKPSVGDVFTVAGDTQTYVVVSATDLAGTDTDVTFSPAAKVAWANDAAVTFKASHVVNLGFHRDAFALAIRPLATPDGFKGGSEIMAAQDPKTGLGLRLEVTREHKRTRYSFDILYGVKLVRAQLATRLAG